MKQLLKNLDLLLRKVLFDSINTLCVAHEVSACWHTSVTNSHRTQQHFHHCSKDHGAELSIWQL